MVVFQENHIEKPDAVVLPSSDPDGHLFEHPHPGGGLPRVEHFGFQPPEPVGIDGGLGGHAAHPLHEVENHALGLQQGDQVPFDIKGDLAGFDPVAVVQYPLERHGRIEPPEDAFGHLDAGQHAGLFDEEFHPPAPVGGDGAERGVVAVADVFGNGQLDQPVDVGFVGFFHGGVSVSYGCGYFRASI